MASMRETVIIAHPHPGETQSLAQRVTAGSENRIIHEAHSPENVHALLSKYDCALLLMDSSLCQQDIASLCIPESTALLIQVEPAETEKYARQLSALAGINDLILPSANPSVLRQRIQRLLDHRNLNHEFSKVQKQLTSLTQKLSNAEESLNSMQHYFDMLYERDGLTGLYNRKYFSKVLKQEFERAKRNDTELTLLLLDVDHFNEVNRNSGQLFGDFVLNEIAARLTTNTEEFALSFRFGGGNFIVLLPQTNVVSAQLIADRLRQSCEKKKFNNTQVSRHITISIGIASLLKSFPSTPDQLLDMADKALYQAKIEGRNRCNVYSSGPGQDMPGNLDHPREMLTKLLDKTRKNSVASIELLTHNLGGEEDRKHIKKALFIIDMLSKRLGLQQPVQQTLHNALTLSICLKFLLHSDLANSKTPTENKDTILEDLPYKLVDLSKIFDFFSQERQILFCHQEWYNGKGYPEGLHGDEIPLGAKILNLADSMAAMTLKTSHGKNLPPEDILNELEQGAGKQWDPQLVLLMLDIIKEEKLIPLETQLLGDTRARLLKTQN